MEKISFASFWTFNIHLSKSFFSSYFFFFFRTSYITAADFPHKLVFNTCSFDICMSHDFTFFQNYLLMCIKQLPWKAEKKYMCYINLQVVYYGWAEGVIASGWEKSDKFSWSR